MAGLSKVLASLSRSRRKKTRKKKHAAHTHPDTHHRHKAKKDAEHSTKHHAKPKHHQPPKHHKKKHKKHKKHHPRVTAPAATAPASKPPIYTPPVSPPPHTAPATQPPPVNAPTPPPGSDVPPVPAQPATAPTTRLTSPIAVYNGPFGHAEATKLMYRAGFGPRPGEADALAAKGMEAAILSLTRPTGAAMLNGPEPVDKAGQPLDPVDVYQHDALYWFDRMLRSDQQLVERMALVFHDWFATNENGIAQLFMLEQTNLFRKYAFGSFKSLVHDVSADPAMILWLNLNKSVVNVPNENYARELMELFTLGPYRGYTEQDIREAARALTGWTSNGDQEAGTLTGFNLIASKHDSGSKTIFGQTGNFSWEDVARLVVDNQMHPSFFVTKLWGYFIASSPTDAEVSALATLYKASGYQIRPVLEAILAHPALYTGPPLVKPPVVYIAGMLRSRQRFINGDVWSYNAGLAGQRLYQPPDVGGWDDSRWLDSNTMLARWQTVYQIMVQGVVEDWNAYSATETPEQAVDAAVRFWDRPNLRQETMDVLLDYATTSVTVTPDAPSRAQRQNALRHLIAISPDYQVC